MVEYELITAIIYLITRQFTYIIFYYIFYFFTHQQKVSACLHTIWSFKEHWDFFTSESSLFFPIFSLVAFFNFFWEFFNFLPYFICHLKLIFTYINLLQIVAKTEHNILKFTLLYVKYFNWIVNFVQNANYI